MAGVGGREVGSGGRIRRRRPSPSAPAAGGHERAGEGGGEPEVRRWGGSGG
jgi:hypothetical protein